MLLLYYLRIPTVAYHCNSLLFVVVDFVTAMLIRATGQKLLLSRRQSLEYLDLPKLVKNSGMLQLIWGLWAVL